MSSTPSFEISEIFKISSSAQFESLALKTFEFQYTHNAVYKNYCHLIGRNKAQVKDVEDIPFLPIRFFKSHKVTSFEGEASLLFESSGTTGMDRSKHFLLDPTIYELSFMAGFELKYGNIEDFIVVGLLPSYLENKHSSLIYMVDHFIQKSNHPMSGYYLNNKHQIQQLIDEYQSQKKILIIGVSYALLDLAESGINLNGVTVMETGGMKGKRKEMTKSALHEQLSSAFNVPNIHSEYGMTELLSQAYSSSNQTFQCPPWMKILLRDRTDPFHLKKKKSGAINVIDLANIFSCSFIETEDLGRFNPNGFEVLGRMDQADIRGCNLLVQ